MTARRFHAQIELRFGGQAMDRNNKSNKQSTCWRRQSVPSKIILFGSYARGDARHDSDVDFLVVESAVRTDEPRWPDCETF